MIGPGAEGAQAAAAFTRGSNVSPTKFNKTPATQPAVTPKPLTLEQANAALQNVLQQLAQKNVSVGISGADANLTEEGRLTAYQDGQFGNKKIRKWAELSLSERNIK